ncbi:hypothetical protein U3516DRAFT_750399 [Neocallimastix sp. 'constans']
MKIHLIMIDSSLPLPPPLLTRSLCAPINDKYNRNNGKGGGSFQYYNSPRDRAPSSLPIYESYYHDRRNRALPSSPAPGPRNDRRENGSYYIQEIKINDSGGGSNRNHYNRGGSPPPP